MDCSKKKEIQKHSSNPNGERNDMVPRETDIVRCPAIGRRDPRKQGAKRHRLVCLAAARIRFDRIGDLPAESRSRGILGELMPVQGPDAKRFSAGSRGALQKHCRLGAVVAGGAVR